MERRQAIAEMVAVSGPNKTRPAPQQRPRQQQLRAAELQQQVLATIDLQEAAILDDSVSSDDYGTPEDVPASPQSGSPLAHHADEPAVGNVKSDGYYGSYPIGTVRG